MRDGIDWRFRAGGAGRPRRRWFKIIFFWRRS